MSVTYCTYLYLGVKLKEFLEIDSKEDFYFKFDPKILDGFDNMFDRWENK